jgi:hypothetical protein
MTQVAERAMSSRVSVSLPIGKIVFDGVVRGGDEEGHCVFKVELPNRRVIYGEWKPVFIKNGNEFNVEIVCVGYASKFNVGNPHPRARLYFSPAEISNMEYLIQALFANSEARMQVAPFRSTKGVFLGGISFMPGWICENIHEPTA